jgi:hypothetical protein
VDGVAGVKVEGIFASASLTQGVAAFIVVILREGGVSSAPRPLNSITGVSGYESPAFAGDGIR